MRYIYKRLLHLCITMFVVSIVVFLMIQLIPGDPSKVILGIKASPEAVERLQRELGLDRPLYEQYLNYYGGVVRGDFGKSLITRVSIAKLIREKLPITLTLTIISMTIAICIAIPVGVISALRQYSWVDNTSTVIAFLGVSMPSFWLGIILILFFGVYLDWLPTIGYVKLTEDPVEWLRHLIMPAFSLGVVYAAVLTRMVRATLLDVLNMDFVRTARAKGLPERRIHRQALRNALIPAVTSIGLGMGYLLGGAVIVENVFAVPGMGSTIVTAVFARDYTTIQGLVFVIALLFMLITLATDLVYTYIDPRIKF